MRHLPTAAMILLTWSGAYGQHPPASQPMDHTEHPGYGQPGCPMHEGGGEADTTMHHPGMSADEIQAHHKEGMHHSFEDAEKWSRVFDDPARDAWQKPKEIVGLMSIKPGMTVADIGAGTGYLMPHLAEAVGGKGRVLALDIEPKLVEHMIARAAKAGLAQVKPKVIQGDDPGLPTAAVDRVVILDTWHHIPERVAYAKKIFEGLKPGGRLVIVDFTAESPFGPPKAHRLAPEAIIDTLRQAGFTAKAAAEDLPHQFAIIGVKP